MITFAYQARDNSGKIVSGSCESVSQDTAISNLMSKGLMVLSIQQKAQAKKLSAKLLSPKETDLVIFTRQLATMVDAGLPLVTGLTALFEQMDPKKQKAMHTITADLIGSVQGGDQFNQAVARFPNAFSRLYVAMVRAGESGGLLSEILDRLAAFLEASARLKKKVKSAMTYPAAVICIAVGISLFLVMKVVPVFAEIFADFGSELPAPTQLLIDISDFLRGYWYVLAAVLVGIYYAIKSWVKTPSGRETWDKWCLKLPIFGPLIHKICMSRMARTFAQMIRSGVPILETLEIIAETSGNMIVEKAIRRTAILVEKGDPLAVSLAKETIFPPMLLRMVSAGEATGKIDTMLEKMADFWDEEIEALLDALTSLIEPLLIVFLGAVVGFIVFALFLPIFKLSDVVSK
jgi:type IV pilus assembly protein PilC